VFDPEKTTAIDRVTLTRDRLVLTLSDGMMQFTQPASGVVHGAAFRGHGRLRIQPPNPLESQQLRLHTGQDALDMEFAEATFVFSDETFDEIAKQAKWQRETDNRLAQLYSDRQREREETGAQLTPRLLRSLSCSARAQSTLFAADLKTNQKGWIRIQFDGLDPEEVSVAQWKTWEGGMQSPDVWLSFPAGGRSPSDAYSNPLAKRDFLVRSYNIDLAVNDAAELSAVARVTLEHMVPDNCVLLFSLDANLRVERVSEGGKPLEFFQPRDPKDRVQSYGDWLAVVLHQPGRQGQRQTMEFQYRGKRVIRRVGQGQFFCQSFGWYPATPNSFAARSDFEINFRSPKKYKLVATGNLIKEGNDGEIALSSWRSDVPLAVAGFAYGDFKAIVEKYMTPIMDLDGNKKMDWFFRQYVYGTGIPEYRFTYQVQDAGGGSWKVSGRIVQSPVTDAWKNILPIYLVSSGRSIRLGWVKVSGQESTFQFTMPMPSKPEKITLNENEDILADIKQ
jgi:hypothetical protein